MTWTWFKSTINVEPSSAEPRFDRRWWNAPSAKHSQALAVLVVLKFVYRLLCVFLAVLTSEMWTWQPEDETEGTYWGAQYLQGQGTSHLFCGG